VFCLTILTLGLWGGNPKLFSVRMTQPVGNDGYFFPVTFRSGISTRITFATLEHAGTMKKLRSHTVGVDSGDLILFSDYEDGGEMWTGRGQRERRRRIRFSEKFKSPPTVQLSPSLWDLDATTIMRADITSESVTKNGFDMIFRTWGDTRIARMRISWMAIGEISELDDWDVE
jgi:hypothetical protein